MLIYLTKSWLLLSLHDWRQFWWSSDFKWWWKGCLAILNNVLSLWLLGTIFSLSLMFFNFTTICLDVYFYLTCLELNIYKVPCHYSFKYCLSPLFFYLIFPGQLLDICLTASWYFVPNSSDFYVVFLTISSTLPSKSNLSHSTSPVFVVGFFQDRVSQAICLG
jgi:hypothetical protein